MANNNAPFGLMPQNLNGTAWSGQAKMIHIPTSQGANIFIGDPLIPLGTTDAFGVPEWGIATAGATHIIGGSFLGRCNGPAGSGVTLTQAANIYYPASTSAYGYVCDDPDVMYTIQEDSSGGAIAIANAGYSVANLVAGAGGSTSTGLSSWQLQSSSAGVNDGTYQVRILGLTRGPDNAIGNYARWNVMINLPVLAPKTAGI
jgi:hypothetical protein